MYCQSTLLTKISSFAIIPSVAYSQTHCHGILIDAHQDDIVCFGISGRQLKWLGGLLT